MFFGHKRIKLVVNLKVEILKIPSFAKIKH